MFNKIQNYQFILNNLSKRNKKRLFFLSFLTLITFFAEVIQLSSLRLFITTIDTKNPLSTEIDQFSNFSFFNNLEIYEIGIAFIFLLIICTILRIIIISYSQKTAAFVSSDISDLIFKKIISASYSWQLRNSNSYSLGIITKDAENLMFLLQSIFMSLSHLILILLILTILIITNANVALSLIIPVSTTYLFLYFINNKKLNYFGKKHIDSSQGIINISLNSLESIKNLIIDNSFNYFLGKYSKNVKEARFSTASINFIYQYPKIIVEFVIIFVLITMLLINYEKIISDNYYWSQLIAITFGVFRLISPLQIFYISYSRISEYQESVLRTQQFYKELQYKRVINFKNTIKVNNNKNHKKIIELKNVSFSYPNTKKLALKKINFEAYEGETIAIVGRSGSGKSTFMDILMGLITQKDGIINFNTGLSDGSKDIRRKWQDEISFVPQRVFIIEDTVASNIAFGIPKSEIDYKKVKWAADKVNLTSRIMEFPNKFDEFLLRNEKSILSGGESQKLGIARGLYKNRKILFFDEIASSLDQTSENEIIALIKSLDKKTTKFIISHNLNKIDYVDKIVVFNNNTIEAIDTYENLMNNNKTFKKLKEETTLEQKS